MGITQAKKDATEGEPGEPPVFWGEVSPCDHVVQIYRHDRVFLDSLEGFVVGGLEAGESVVVIATPEHRKALEDRLAARGIDLSRPRRESRFIDLDAADTLLLFLRDGWPDAALFRGVITGLMKRARSGSRRVRAFGEMTALLWARGDHGATLRLEHLWHTLCLAQGFSLYCAYPGSGFTQDAGAAIFEICETHSQVHLDS